MRLYLSNLPLEDIDIVTFLGVRSYVAIFQNQLKRIIIKIFINMLDGVLISKYTELKSKKSWWLKEQIQDITMLDLSTTEILKNRVYQTKNVNQSYKVNTFEIIFFNKSRLMRKKWSEAML